MENYSRKIVEYINKREKLKNTVIFLEKYTPKPISALFYIMLIYLAVKMDVRVFVMGFVPFFTFVLATVIGKSLDFKRPFEKEGFEPIINHSKGHSFPSRHASSSFVISMGGYFLNPYIGIAAFILSTIVCATRILTGVHYLRDVLCGALMGTIIGYIGFFVLNPF